MKYANMHMHSTYSDASLSPVQLIRIGKSLGYHAMALTDHETDGGVKEFMYHAQKEGVHSVSGVEFFGLDEGLITDLSLHIVALDYDMDNPQMRAFIEKRRELMNECTRKRFELAVEKGLIQDITWYDVVDYNPPGTWLCGNSIFNAMEGKRIVPYSYNFEPIRACFRSPEAKAFSQALPHVEEVIKVIRQADGIAILAHPNDQIHMVEKLVGYGLNGIEVSHPSLKGHTPYLAAEAAETFGLYRSGGTDHTGPMSGVGGNRAIPVFHGITEEEFNAIRERRPYKAL